MSGPGAELWDRKISESDAHASALYSEFGSLGETIKSYIIFAVAIIALEWFRSEYSFFFVSVVFAALFFSTAHVKASLSVMRAGSSDTTRRTMLELAALANEFPLAFVTILLVQVAMARLTPFFSDGHFTIDSLLLPFALFFLLFGEWYARRARCTLEPPSAAAADEKTE